jgi:Subtilase family
MREPSIRSYFAPPGSDGNAGPRSGGTSVPDGAGRRDHDDDSAPGLTYIPTAVLERHGARVLTPGTAAVVPGYPAPRSTVYRARSLLIPARLLQQSEFVEAANAVLARVGMSLVVPQLPGETADSDDRITGTLAQVPRPAVLRPAVPASGRPAVPVVIDAWIALQALRAAASAHEYPALSDQVVRSVALEHLLIGSAITGSPITEGNATTGSPITEGNGVTGPSSTDSYVYAGGDTRTPVAVSLEAPRRTPAKDCDFRRPVVAVLDTGVRAHPWLDVLPDSVERYATIPGGFVAIDPAIQHAIYADGEAAALAGDRPRQVIHGPWDVPVTADPLIGELDTDTGHGTFIAGIVRQVAAEAQVLAIRIMHSDGIVNEGDLINALVLLAGRIAAAEAGDMAAMVDVVSLSLGYFDESPADVTYSSGLWLLIELLLSLGVPVVTAAGNYSTSRRFYPAAFSLQPTPGIAVPLISVGALNPNGSRALFSDGGRWINAWASGAAVVSTFPVDINASRCPEVRVRSHPGNGVPPGLPDDREALDPDSYRSGFAVWSGTSFSAPLLAAQIARSLLAVAADPALSLGEPGAHAASDRATAALQDMGWPG